MNRRCEQKCAQRSAQRSNSGGYDLLLDLFGGGIERLLAGGDEACSVQLEQGSLPVVLL